VIDWLVSFRTRIDSIGICSSHHIEYVMWWCCWQGNGLVILRSWVWFLDGHHCIVASGKLLTPVCLCHQAV